MFIKKIKVEKDSIFNKTIIISLYEDEGGLFKIEGYEGFNKRDLFNPNKIKKTGKTGDIDVKSLPLSISVVYLSDDISITALIIEDNVSKKFYSFRVDPQKPNVLKLQSNYISSSLDELCKDYETSGSRRKTYKGESNFQDIKNLDYLEFSYQQLGKKHIDKNAKISRVIFQNSNRFTADFALKAERKEIKLTGDFSLKEISSTILSQHRFNRYDSILINTKTRQIEYYIYSYKPRFQNLYYLFKRTKENEYELIEKSVSFNKLFLTEELKNLKYADLPKTTGEALSNTRLEDFVEEFVNFIEDEKLDELLTNEFGKTKKQLDVVSIPASIKIILAKYECNYESGYLYFNDYELFPLGFLDKSALVLYENRNIKGENPIQTFSFKRVNDIDKAILNLLINEPSSRVIILNKLIDEVTFNFYEGKEEQDALIKDIEDMYASLWPTDKKNYRKTIATLMSKFSDWKNRNKDKIAKFLKDIPVVESSDVELSLHGSLRIEERIGKMSETEKLNLAKAAYEKGKTAWHFYGSFDNDFKVLSYIQSKHPDREIRLYNDFVFVYQRKIPHALVTCLSYKESFDNFMSRNKEVK